MKYIKLFENNSISIDFYNNICWIINGDLNQILEILNKLLDNYMKDSPNRIKYNVFYVELELLINEIKHVHLNNINGMILFSKPIAYEYKDLTLSFKFFKIFNDEVYRNIDNERCTLLGEIKIENDKILFDTTIIDMKKYNL